MCCVHEAWVSYNCGQFADEKIVPVHLLRNDKSDLTKYGRKKHSPGMDWSLAAAALTTLTRRRQA